MASSSVAADMELDRPNLEDYLPPDSLPQEAPRNLHLRDLLDISPVLTEAAGAIVDDSFTRCFKSNSPEPWNWNIYLFPLWCFGVVIRYGILFPLRSLTLALGWLAFFAAFFPVHFLFKGQDKLRSKIELVSANSPSHQVLGSKPSFCRISAGRKLVEMMCSVFVASWTGVIKYHGPRPSTRPHQLFSFLHAMG